MVSDETIFAYLQGKLPPDEARRLQEQVKADVELQRRMEICKSRLDVLQAV